LVPKTYKSQVTKMKEKSKRIKITEFVKTVLMVSNDLREV
jgi:hypothetical protein